MRALSYFGIGTLVAGSVIASAVPSLADGKVVLYTAHESVIVEAMVPLFEAATGIQAEVIKAGSGDIIRRALAEKDNPKADVIWSIGAEQLQANNEILQDYTPKEVTRLTRHSSSGTSGCHTPGLSWCLSPTQICWARICRRPGVTWRTPT